MNREEQIEATIATHCEAWLAAGNKLVTHGKCQGQACALYTLPGNGSLVARGASIGMNDMECWDFTRGFDGETSFGCAPTFFKMGNRVALRFGVRS